VRTISFPIHLSETAATKLNKVLSLIIVYLTTDVNTSGNILWCRLPLCWQHLRCWSTPLVQRSKTVP